MRRRCGARRPARPGRPMRRTLPAQTGARTASMCSCSQTRGGRSGRCMGARMPSSASWPSWTQCSRLRRRAAMPCAASGAPTRPHQALSTAACHCRALCGGARSGRVPCLRVLACVCAAAARSAAGVRPSCWCPFCHLCAVLPWSKGQMCVLLDAERPRSCLGPICAASAGRRRAQRPQCSLLVMAAAASQRQHQCKPRVVFAAGGFLCCRASGLAGRSSQAQAGATTPSSPTYPLPAAGPTTT